MKTDFEDKPGGTKFTYDKGLLQGKLGYDLAEEKRRQRWVFNLNNPVSTQMKELSERVQNKTMTFDQFSERIAKTYRVLTSKKPVHFKISYKISRNEAIDISMEDVEIGN